MKREPDNSVRNLSSADYVNLFLTGARNDIHYKSAAVQVYDYGHICRHMKVPTTIFRPDYNYALLLTDGNVVTQLGLETKRIYAPAALFVSAGQLISVQSVSENIAGTLVILENESLNRIFSETDLLKILHIPPFIDMLPEDMEMVNSIGKLLLYEYAAPSPESPIIFSLVEALLFKLLKHSGVNEQLSRNHLTAIQFRELVYLNFATEKNVLFYTRALSISENYLNRCTQAIFGKSAKRFILEAAILQSQLLLQDRDKSIAEVAYELNFEDASYFTRLFRRITGITPSAYKQQLITQA